MLQPEYTIIHQSDLLTVQWEPPNLPPPFLAVGTALLLAGIALVIFRNALSSRGAGRWGRWITPKSLLGMGVVFAMIGGLAIALTGPKAPLMSWSITPDRLTVRSLNGEISVPWSEVKAVTIDRREAALENASLGLSYGNGKEVWLVLKWLVREHRAGFVRALAERIPAPMRPVTEDDAYREAINLS